MHLKISAVVAFVLGLAAIVDAPAAVGDDWDKMKQVIEAAYFSDACRREAESLGIAPTSDAVALFAALRDRVVLTRGADRPDGQHDYCRTPVILLTNLLRLNGVDAELVFASMPKNTIGAAPSGRIDRVLVYIAARDRYFDPAASLGKQAALDGIIRERTKRVHLRGPSLADARDACHDTCMVVYPPVREPSVRVKTQVIRDH